MKLISCIKTSFERFYFHEMAIKLNWFLEIIGLASDVGLVETMELPKEMKQVSGYRHDEEQNTGK